ncbi:carboxypeptidase-like regulatory domain-containing protein [Flavobacterium limi]|uniref:Alpha-2-macroglobulin domain-containing protein n=1 Tax=Flavobacterium limi TaxID=2045105 RepID=A0ABQ1U1G4_9FLAO|nr:carboxypeptidase-like regulatory domain-containing protein [Flavobacterium limi]GGF07546.1 hypothetical protein GCM10011518_15970 [Flavobacterium limi]
MKKIVLALLLLTSGLFAQTDKKWNKVIALENEGKVKSASGIVTEIYKKAVSEKDEVQMIKCFFYHSKYLQVVDENAQTKILNNLKKDIDRVSIPSKAILNFVYAKCLNDYYSNNQYILYDRINTSSLDEDFMTWTETTFNDQINNAYKKTIENEAVLKNTPLTKYEAVFDYLTDEEFKNQTLYDYLLKENIVYYSSKIKEWEIDKKEFSKHKKELLANSKDFINLNLDFVTNQPLKEVLNLYQQQEKIHPGSENQWGRIQFCKKYVIENNEDYLLSLIDLQNISTNEELIQKIRLEKALVYLQLASKNTYPDYKIKAAKLLDSILVVNNHSNTYKLASREKKQLNSKSLYVQLQENNYKDENTRAFIKYNNIDHLKVSFFKITQKQLAELSKFPKYSDILTHSVLEKQKPIVSKDYTLLNKKDYFQYSTEILLPKLEKGCYVIYFESNSLIKNAKAFAFDFITVSNIAVLAKKENLKDIFQIVDRKTGFPLENVTIQTPKQIIKTDNNGVASFEKIENNYYSDDYIQFSTPNDTLSIRKRNLNSVYDYSNHSTEKTKGKVSFYLDRAIYRPGQKVYFKGIATQKNNDKTSVLPNSVFKIAITDANYNDFKEFEVTTNEFGSFSGEFDLPKNGKNGYYGIRIVTPNDHKNRFIYDPEKEEYAIWNSVEFENSQTDFRVEEYKRPKFEVKFEPKKQTFQVNQSVKIKGNATAFAGSPVSNVSVKYQISLKPYVNENGHYYFKNGKSETISNGETQTDATGKFEINFIAKPSENLTKEKLPVFEYHIKASVTDINGETRDASTSIKVGYHDLILGTFIPAQIETKNKNEIILSSTNLNGEFAAVKGELKIYFASPLSHKLKRRIFQQPEIESISKEDFERLFPYEKNETDESADSLVYTKKIDTEKDKKIALNFISNYKSGNYKVVFSAKDTFQNNIESSSIFQLFQNKDRFNFSKLFTAEQINKDAKKDGFVLIKLTSVIPDLYISTYGNYKSKQYIETNIRLQNHEGFVKIPIKKEFEKAMNVSFQSVFENESHTAQINVTLKTDEKGLELDTATFRNKIEPGNNESWSFKLKSINTNTESEILASMYDNSLDQFYQKKWPDLKFSEYHGNYATYKTGLGFENTSGYLHNLNPLPNKIELSNENNIKLMWFGFNFHDSFTLHQQREYQKQLNKKIKKPVDTKKISGIITDQNNLPVPGVLISIKGTQRKATSDVDGYYEIEAAKNEELFFSCIGYKSQSISIENIKEINIQLADDIDNLKEVVVVGYGSLKKKDSTGAVAMVVEEDNNVYNTAGVDEPLQVGSFKKITEKDLEALNRIQARKNLSETAFFLPNLKTDSKGRVSFNFTSPEALTAWKLRLMAHNKDAVSGYLEKSVVTQKELMVLPNFPRFFREKDTIVISAKISNVTAKAKTGISVLQFFDATTMQPIDAKMLNADNIKNFTIPAYGNTKVNWKITIPEGLQGVQYKILAKSDSFSDGEESILPVLTNNMLVTESIPIWVRENSFKEYTFENLKNNTSTTLRNHQFTLEYTSNPTWIAIQSLPYLMEYEHECAEQTFARFYANALASEVISSNPKIATVFEDWRKNGKLNSKLEENEELKSIILAETPWLKDAQSEEEKKKNLALLFDLEKMKTSQEATFQKLKQKQKASGGFSWFDGSDENEYITRHILAGLGHLSKLSKGHASQIDEIAKTGIPYIDSKFLEHYRIRTKNIKKADKLIWINPHFDLHYLYARSFYLEKYPLSDTLKKASKLYLETAKNNWLSYSLYEKGMTALTLNRYGEKDTAKNILESLKETSSNNEDWGMYWIANKPGWYWYQAPIETQALLIEAFAEVTNDTRSVDAMKVWLLKNKQTKNWPTTKSTTEAVYALLMQGTDWLSVKDNTIVKLGDEKIMTKKLAENEKEAATGYIKMNWKADEVKKEMASISIENKSKVPGFGGVYWQYFEDLDKIKTNSGAVLSVAKELYLKKSTLKGNELEKITSKNPLKTGDLVTVRLIISSKEDTEYVHLKDMRASCFEPVNVLSEYKYKDGLGYYMSTKDAATHLFFDHVNKGTYVIEYDIRVNNSGEFSNGITTIESMYAPEFTSHTKGIRVKVN